MVRKSAYESVEADVLATASGALPRTASPESKSSRIQAMVSADESNALNELAGYYGVSVSRIVRDLVEAYLDSEADTLERIRESRDGREYALGRRSRWPLRATIGPSARGTSWTRTPPS